MSKSLAEKAERDGPGIAEQDDIAVHVEKGEAHALDAPNDHHLVQHLALERAARDDRALLRSLLADSRGLVVQHWNAARPESLGVNTAHRSNVKGSGVGCNDEEVGVALQMTRPVEHVEKWQIAFVRVGHHDRVVLGDPLAEGEEVPLALVGWHDSDHRLLRGRDPPCGWEKGSLYLHRTLSAEQLGTRYRHSIEKYIAAEKRREKDTRPKSAAKHTATLLDTHKTERFKRRKEACVSENQSANGKQPLQSCTL